MNCECTAIANFITRECILCTQFYGIQSHTYNIQLCMYMHHTHTLVCTNIILHKQLHEQIHSKHKHMYIHAKVYVCTYILCVYTHKCTCICTHTIPWCNIHTYIHTEKNWDIYAKRPLNRNLHTLRLRDLVYMHNEFTCIVLNLINLIQLIDVPQFL